MRPSLSKRKRTPGFYGSSGLVYLLPTPLMDLAVLPSQLQTNLERSGLSQSEFARSVGTSSQNVRNFMFHYKGIKSKGPGVAKIIAGMEKRGWTSTIEAAFTRKPLTGSLSESDKRLLSYAVYNANLSQETKDELLDKVFSLAS